MKTILLIFIVLGLNTESYSQWVNIRMIDGGNILKFTQDSLGNIYAATSTKKIYKSSDNCNSWKDFSNGLPDVNIEDLLSTRSAVFAATFGYGIYKTTNQGQNWFPSNSGVSTNYAMSFTLDNEYVFAGTQNGVYRSSNNGDLWNYANGEIGFTHGVHDMVAVNDSNMFATTSIGASGSIYRSTNQGNNWILANNGLPGFYLSDLEYCANKIFAGGTDETLYQTTDNGLLWQVLVNYNSYVNSMKSKGDTIVVGTNSNSSPQISTDCGLTWNVRNQGLPVSRIYDILINRDFMITALDQGVYKSTNFGLNWFNSSTGIGGVEVADIYSFGNIVLAGTFGFGMFRSTNSGLNWTQLNVTGNIDCKNFLYKDSIFYFSTTSQIYKSTDKGLTWSEYGMRPPLLDISFTVKGNKALIGSFIDGIYKTTNGGGNWYQSMNGITNLLIYKSVFLDMDSITYVFINDIDEGSKLYYSTNYGDQWIPFANTGLNFRINTLENIGGAIYAGTTGNGVYKSNNGGNNFVPDNNGIPVNSTVTSFTFGNDTIYVSLLENGIFKRHINSDQWISISNGFPNQLLYVVNSGPNYLYAGARGGLYLRNTTIVNLSVNGFSVPEGFILHQNYPNPFNPSTVIKYEIPDKQHITLKIYNVLGNEIETLINEVQQAGNHEVRWNALNLPSGIYYYKIQSDRYNETMKMILLK